MNAVATLQAKASGPPAADGPVPWSPGFSDVLAALLVLGAFGVAYAPSFQSLIGQWNRDPNYSYGFFVIPIAVVIFASRRALLDRSKMVPRWWGFLPLAAVVALRFPLYEWNELYVETATIPLVTAGLALALGGWHLLRVALPSIIFLFFMLPLPPNINALLAQPLQKWATIGSVALLQLFMPVMSEGNVIVIGQTPLEVARACNGLSMLLSFVTLIAATVILVQRPVVERVILMLSAIPIAVLTNILRIAATAVCYHWLGQAQGEKIAHDLAGYAMMPVALLFVWLELKILSWLFVEVEEVDMTGLLRKQRSHNSGVA
jgi:exosortase